MIDLAVAPDVHALVPTLVLHRANCPIVRQQAEDGVPVLTMLACQDMPPRTDQLRRCDCLTRAAAA